MDRDVPRTKGQPDHGPGEPDNVIESRYFFAHDLLGSVVAATLQRAQPDDEPGLVVAERYTYSAYGEVQVWTQGWNGSQYGGERSYSPIGMPYLYTGQRQDAETGLWYFKNRVYDGQSGRFLRRDLLGYADGPHLYRYAGGRPNTAVDPLGLLTAEQAQGKMAAEADFQRRYSRSNGSFVGRIDNMVHGLGAEWKNATQFYEVNLQWARIDPAMVSDKAWDLLEAAGAIDADGKQQAKYGSWLYSKYSEEKTRQLSNQELKDMGATQDPTNPSVWWLDGKPVATVVTEVETGYRWERVDDHSGPALLFDGRNLYLNDPSRGLNLSWPAVAGHPLSSPADQRISNYGPIPEGRWQVDPAKTQHFQWYDPRDWDWYGPRGRQAWGDTRVPIDPAADGPETDRGGFFIHGGEGWGSEGCIDLCTGEDSFFSVFETYHAPMPLTVDYPDYR